MPQAAQTSTPNPSTHGDSVLRLAGLCLLAGLVIAGLLSLPPVAHLLAASTSRQDQVYSELSFINYAQLPKLLRLNQTTAIRYRLTNHEGGAKTYHVAITLVQPGRPTVLLRQDTILLANGQASDQAIPVRVTQTGQTFQLTIALLDQNNHIRLRLQS